MEEGETKSEERDRIKREKFEEKKAQMDRRRERIKSRYSPEYRAMQEEAAQQGLRPPLKDQSSAFVNAPSTTINNSSSSSSAMVMPHIAAQDMTDPYELAFAP